MRLHGPADGHCGSYAHAGCGVSSGPPCPTESYSAEGATERIKRQTLYNAAHETVLADQISTFGQRDRVKREQ